MEGTSLKRWYLENEPEEKLIYCKEFWQQVFFVRDVLSCMVFGSRADGESNIHVIGHHTSKSVKLPVYKIFVKELGLTLILRGNFSDWKVSVISSAPVECDFLDLFDTSEEWTFHYCEGFDHANIFTSYLKNKNNFTLELQDSYELYTFIRILTNSLNKL
jgi:hypothetical protein